MTVMIYPDDRPEHNEYAEGMHVTLTNKGQVGALRRLTSRQ